MSGDIGIDTSGNMLADKRYRLARDLAGDDDHTAAADLLVQALELTPDWPAGWFALGRERMCLGDRIGAETALRRAIALDASDGIGATLALASLGAIPTPSGAPPAYTARLFDEYAARFESHLLNELGYCGPVLLRMALDTIAPAPERFSRALDLGCGTGLAGVTLRDRVDWLTGVDLSPAMIAQTRAKGLYDELETGDLFATLAATRGWDLVLAADVMIYTGALLPLFEAIRNALSPVGLFAFTLQRAPEGGGVRVGRDLRFAHAPDYVASCAADAGLRVVWWDTASARRDGGEDVPGLVVVLAH